MAESTPVPAGPGEHAEADDRLRRQAVATLMSNWRGASTVPTSTLYPHQWSWDSAFIAIGLARVSVRRAYAELASLHGAQWADGRVPQIVFNRGVAEDAYFPGPAFWRPLPADGPPGDVATTGLVQPPMHAAAALAVAARSPGRDARTALRRLYPRLAAYHDYLFTRRLVQPGLAAIVHPWESGLDNSPAWDGPLRAVQAPVGDIPRLRRDLLHAGAAHRPTDQDYARYLHIAAHYRDRGYADTDLTGLPFCVVDPLFNALLAWSERALAELAGFLGLPGDRHLDRAGALEQALHRHLFDARLGCYVALDARTGERIPRRTVGGLVPLVLPGLPADHRDALLATLTGPAFGVGGRARGVPSYDLTAPDLDLHRYWRGPAWINTSWLVWQGLRRAGQDELAARLARSMVRLVSEAGFREYFDPLTGQGLGASDFSWSAALAIDVLDTPDAWIEVV